MEFHPRPTAILDPACQIGIPRLQRAPLVPAGPFFQPQHVPLFVAPGVACISNSWSDSWSSFAEFIPLVPLIAILPPLVVSALHNCACGSWIVPVAKVDVIWICDQWTSVWQCLGTGWSLVELGLLSCIQVSPFCSESHMLIFFCAQTHATTSKNKNTCVVCTTICVVQWASRVSVRVTNLLGDPADNPGHHSGLQCCVLLFVTNLYGPCVSRVPVWVTNLLGDPTGDPGRHLGLQCCTCCSCCGLVWFVVLRASPPIVCLPTCCCDWFVVVVVALVAAIF